MNVKVITCGGTFDMTAFGASGSFYAESAVFTLLRRLKSVADVSVTALMQIDSAFMTPAHRDAIVAEIRSSSEQRFVVTHGTDTIAETAAYLGVRTDGRTVVLTGAFSPALDADSDAPGNLAAALTAARLLGPGAYLAFHGDIFPAGRFRKNVAAQRFERI